MNDKKHKTSGQVRRTCETKQTSERVFHPLSRSIEGVRVRTARLARQRGKNTSFFGFLCTGTSKTIYTLSVLLGSVFVLMLVGVVTGRSQADNNPFSGIRSSDPVEDYVDSFCFDGKVGPMDVEDLVNEYTKHTNDYFNEKIKYIMKHTDDKVPSPSLEGEKYRELCQEFDMTCQAIAVCNLNADEALKAHPFCIAVTLTGIPPHKAFNYDKNYNTNHVFPNWSNLENIEPLKYSYFCYKAALDKKRDAIWDGSPQALLNKCGTEFQKPEDKEICDLKAQIEAETDSSKKSGLQTRLTYAISERRGWWGPWADMGPIALTSATSVTTVFTGKQPDFIDSAAKRIKFIDEEIVRSKTALDQTLDAYSQLNTAWKMHVQYMDIFSELVKYRDHLVNVRKQTDVFPFRFIDATTTKCL